VITDSLHVSVERFEAETGWALKPQGACKGELCVPLPSGTAAEGGAVDVAAVAGALGMPVVHDEERGLWSVGPETLSGHALSTVEAPELELPDLEGNLFRLSSLRGQKVVLVAWAPY
jgi:hypothetical protein